MSIRDRIAPDRLYHFTCDHGHLGIGESGLIVPASMLLSSPHGVPWTAVLVWCTDLERPSRDAVGLTSVVLPCDRMAHRYRVDPTLATPWVEIRHRIRERYPDDVDRLETTPGARPMHWWVSSVPLMADYDPVVVSS
jgi:hypothetical protein